MNEPPQDSEPVNFQGRFDIRYLKAGEHSLLIPIPDQIAMSVGRIAILWGGFELRMDIVIKTILPRLHKQEPKGWQRFPFKKRKRLFKDLMAEYTGKLFPTETKSFQTIADQSGDLHWRRNIIVHGYIVARRKTDTDSPTSHAPDFFATGAHKGKQVEIPLDEPTLEKLRHDIAHLGGNLMAAISRMGGRLESGSPEIVVPDIELLQNDQSGNFRILAI